MVTGPAADVDKTAASRSTGSGGGSAPAAYLGPVTGASPDAKPGHATSPDRHTVRSASISR